MLVNPALVTTFAMISRTLWLLFREKKAGVPLRFVAITETGRGDSLIFGVRYRRMCEECFSDVWRQPISTLDIVIWS